MPDYDNELRGVLFRNDKKGNDKAPEYKGESQIEGVEYEVAAWIRTSQRGAKYMSLKFEKKGARQAQQTNAPAPATAPENVGAQHSDEEIPF